MPHTAPRSQDARAGRRVLGSGRPAPPRPRMVYKAPVPV